MIKRMMDAEKRNGMVLPVAGHAAAEGDGGRRRAGGLWRFQEEVLLPGRRAFLWLALFVMGMAQASAALPSAAVVAEAGGAAVCPKEGNGVQAACQEQWRIAYAVPPVVTEAEQWLAVADFFAKARCRIDADVPSDSLRPGVKGWLQKYSGFPGDAVRFMNFVSQVLLPLLDGGKNVMISHREQLNLLLSREKYSRGVQSVQEMTSHGIRLALVSRTKPAPQASLNWYELWHNGMLRQWILAMLENVPLTERERQSLLAMLVFSGDGARVLPWLSNTGGNVEYWRRMLTLRDFAGRELEECLKLHRQMAQGCASGDLLGARECARGLLRHRQNWLVRSLRKQLEDVLHRTAWVDPGERGGILLRQAMRLLRDGNAEDALRNVMAARVRYARVSYPEQTEWNRIWQDALQVLEAGRTNGSPKEARDGLPLYRNVPPLTAVLLLERTLQEKKDSPLASFRKLTPFALGMPGNGARILQEIGDGLPELTGEDNEAALLSLLRMGQWWNRVEMDWTAPHWETDGWLEAPWGKVAVQMQSVPEEVAPEFLECVEREAWQWPLLAESVIGEWARRAVEGARKRGDGDRECEILRRLLAVSAPCMNRLYPELLELFGKAMESRGYPGVPKTMERLKNAAAKWE